MKVNTNIFKNEYTKIILGIIWGLGIACIFRSACNGRNCIVYKAPKPNDVKNSIYAHDEKCYKYDTVSTDCNDSAII
jgi:hypothetical protein